MHCTLFLCHHNDPLMHAATGAIYSTRSGMHNRVKKHLDLPSHTTVPLLAINSLERCAAYRYAAIRRESVGGTKLESKGLSRSTLLGELRRTNLTRAACPQLLCRL